MAHPIQTHLDQFHEYAEQMLRCCQNDPTPISLKIEHTENVLAHAQAIGQSEKLEPAMQRAVLLGALYHDIARFEQYLRYNTFKDALSFNHGMAGVKILKQLKFLDQEEENIKKLALVGIGMHNRRALPNGLSAPQQTICHILRDADKLDILRVMDEHLARRPYNPTVILGLPDNDELCNKEVVACALRGKCASYSDLRSVNDFRVLLGSWFYDMHFNASREIFQKAGHGINLILHLPQNDCYRKVRQTLVNTINS